MFDIWLIGDSTEMTIVKLEEGEELMEELVGDINIDFVSKEGRQVLLLIGLLEWFIFWNLQKTIGPKPINYS